MPTVAVEDSFERLRALEKKRFDSERKGRIPVMDAETLRELCLENDGYETPELNDSLYAHFRGFQKIEGLAPYCNLKALWLESNGLSRIEGLAPLVHLRCLYLSKNLISAVENMEALRALNTLDLSENRLTSLRGLAQLPSLASLNVSRNQLASASDLRELEACAELTNLDVSHNHIDDNQEEGDESVLALLARVPQLKALRITGNPMVSRTKHFRKAFIAAMPQLAFLDRPVFPIERAAVDAWKEGGNDAELRAKRAFVDKENDERRRTLHEFREWQAQVRERRLLEIEQEKKARRLAEASPVDGDENAPPPLGVQAADCEVELHGFRGITKDEYLRLGAAERATWDERIRKAHADSAKDRLEVLGDGVARLGATFWAENARGEGLETPVVGAVDSRKPEMTSRADQQRGGAAGSGSALDSSDGGGETSCGESEEPRPPPYDAATSASRTVSAAESEAANGETDSGPRQSDTPEASADPVNPTDVALKPARVSPGRSPPPREEATGGPSLLPPPAPISPGSRQEPRATEAAADPLPPAPMRGVSGGVSGGSVFPGPKGTEPRETWAQLQRRAREAPCPVRPPALPSAFAVRACSFLSRMPTGVPAWMFGCCRRFPS